MLCSFSTHSLFYDSCAWNVRMRLTSCAVLIGVGSRPLKFEGTISKSQAISIRLSVSEPWMRLRKHNGVHPIWSFLYCKQWKRWLFLIDLELYSGVPTCDINRLVSQLTQKRSYCHWKQRVRQWQGKPFVKFPSTAHKLAGKPRR